MKTVLLAALLALVAAASANAVVVQPTRSAHHVSPNRSYERRMMLKACVAEKVVAGGWVCPMQAPSRSFDAVRNVNEGGGGGWPACGPSTNGWYFWSGSRWWKCGFNPYYGWIWVPV